MHLQMIQAGLYQNQGNNKQLDNGYLHLCSRSITFDSESITHPLVKLRYNQHFKIERFTGDQLVQTLSPQNNNAQSASRQQNNFFSNNNQQFQQQPQITLNKGQQSSTQNQNQYTTLPNQNNQDQIFGGNSGGQTPYNDNSDQNQQLKTGNKLTAKKQAITKNKNRTTDSIGSVSPSKSFRPSSQQNQQQQQPILIDSPQKLQFLKDFYMFISTTMTQQQQQLYSANNINSSNLSIQEQLFDMNILLISVKQVIKIPRHPPGPQFFDKDANQKLSTDQNIKYMLFVMTSDELQRQQFVNNLLQFTQPDSLSQGQGLYLSEDDILKRYIDNEKKKYLEYIKHSEQSDKQSKYLIKQVVKRVTIEGEHNYLVLLQHDSQKLYNLQLIPIMNSPYQIMPIFISLDQIKYVQTYRYLFQYNSIRIVTHQSHEEYILVFSKQESKDKCLNLLLKHCPNLLNDQLNDISYYQNQWVNGVISNGDYLLYLNFISHRSFNDLTQYPVFPWVISDYKNDTLNYQKTSITFRDLQKPIGALYTNQQQENALEKPYMFLSHYSTPGIVLYYLIRQVPSYILKVQNEGYGGPPDRIFYDIGHSWANSLKILADNKELIPEFYFGDGSFLLNNQQLELGLNHLEEKVDQATLPPWAKNHQDFIIQNRQALESNHISASLHHWIDLVFGYLQKGEKASLANNLFQPTSLEDNVNWSQITSPLEKQALEAQLKNFGQCPVQIFQSAHLERLSRVINLKSGGSILHTMNIQQQQQMTQRSGANQMQDQSGLEQQCELQLTEIQNLKKAFDEINEKNEENLMKQMQEFKFLDEKHRRRITRYKEDSDKQISKYRQMIDFLKQQKKQVRDELDMQRQREFSYLQEIESLRNQVMQSQNLQSVRSIQVSSGADNQNFHHHHTTITSSGNKQSHQFNPQQLSQLLEKKPATAEYLKTLDIHPSSSQQINALGHKNQNKLSQGNIQHKPVVLQQQQQQNTRTIGLIDGTKKRNTFNTNTTKQNDTNNNANILNVLPQTQTMGNSRLGIITDQQQNHNSGLSSNIGGSSSVVGRNSQSMTMSGSQQNQKQSHQQQLIKLKTSINQN
eukprot:403360000